MNFVGFWGQAAYTGTVTANALPKRRAVSPDARVSPRPGAGPATDHRSALRPRCRARRRPYPASGSFAVYAAGSSTARRKLAHHRHHPALVAPATALAPPRSLCQGPPHVVAVVGVRT
ncbi:hypothetical protein GCM10027176_25240 [Actinoallomurus bryophytorum]